MQTACFLGQHAADRATKLLPLSPAGWEQREEEGCCPRVGIGVAPALFLAAGDGPWS